VPIRAVLWDADGVLQVLPPFDTMWTFLPEETRQELLAETFGSDFHDVLTGRVDMARRVDDTVERLGLREHREEILAVWGPCPPVLEARAAVAEVRRAGITCVLATNQDTLREATMRPIYAPLMDHCYFSSAIGLAKPDEAFFAYIAEDLGLPTADLLFLDDSQANVAGARAAGLNAEWWHHDEGVGALHARLSAHGIS
jgi:putative hydrolase of the HAD superfamily